MINVLNDSNLCLGKIRSRAEVELKKGNRNEGWDWGWIDCGEVGSWLNEWMFDI